MTDEAMTASDGLHRGGLGLVAVATMGAAVMSPALGIYGLFPTIESQAGRVAPLIFLLCLAISLPTALSYALVARNVTSAGGGYTWLWNSTRPSAGMWLGWMISTYYEVAVFAVISVFGLFFNELLAMFGVSTGNGTWALGLLVAIIVVAAATYTNIHISARVAFGLLLFEAATVFGLATTVLIVRGSQGVLTPAPFEFSNASHGMSGIMAALVIGVFSFAGYEIVSTMAEESKKPRRVIPLATILSLVLVGLFWVYTSYGMSFAVPLDKLASLTASSASTPMVPLSKMFWGWGSLFVVIAGLTSTLAICLSDVVGTSRTMFAMSRDRVIAPWFGRLHPKHRTPWNSIHILVVLGIGVPLVTGFLIGPANNLNAWASSMVFFALLTYMLVNVANAAYHWRHRRAEFNWLTNAAVPAVGIVVDAYVLYKGFFDSMWNAYQPAGHFDLAAWVATRGVVLFSVAWSAIGIGYVALRLRQRPELAHAVSHGIDEDHAAVEDPRRSSPEQNLDPTA